MNIWIKEDEEGMSLFWRFEFNREKGVVVGYDQTDMGVRIQTTWTAGTLYWISSI
jgi:hypothetical protein